MLESEWVTFEGVHVTAPTLGEYSSIDCTISWTNDDTTNISHYVYTINGSEEVRVDVNGTRSVYLNDGDVLNVKCVVSEERTTKGYVDSVWVLYVCTDTRTVLATPTNVKIEDGTLLWKAVDGASYYIFEWTYGGYTELVTWRKTSLAIESGSTYRIRAVSEDWQTYRPSAWTESITYTSDEKIV